MNRTVARLLFAAAFCLATAAANAQPLLRPAWLIAHPRSPDLLVLDLRDAAAHNAGHIPGAVAADFNHAGWRIKTDDGAAGALPPTPRLAAMLGGLGVGEHTHVVLVADHFSNAARAYWTLLILGHRDVSILDGGWQGWLAAGGKPDTHPVSPRPARFVARDHPDLRARIGDVETTLAKADATLLDARPAAQFLGQAKAPPVARPGHLPGAQWVDQASTLAPDGSLKSPADLTALFARIDPARPVIVYCNPGDLSATDWFVLSQILHRRNVRLYEGSMSQWAHDPSRPLQVEAAPPP